MTRVVVCSASDETRALLAGVLSASADLELLGEAIDLDEALALSESSTPDVVFLDASLPPGGGTHALLGMQEFLPDARFVAFAQPEDTEEIAAMLDAGADTYCVADAPLWEIERIAAGPTEPLARLAHGLARSAGGRRAGELVARELAELTGAALAATYLLDDGAELVLAGLAGTATPVGVTEAPGVVARSFAGPALVEAAATELGELSSLVPACRQALAVPLVADGRTLGALLVAMDPERPLRADPAVVAAVADLVAASLAREQRLAATHEEARRDALTGLGNRRAFDEHLERAVRRAGAGGEPVGLALIDLDSFKEINDTKGHGAGDRVLQEVARGLLRGVRSNEEVFRSGGDEFAVVVAGDSRSAALVASRLQAELRRRRRGTRLPTLSCGIASAPGDAEGKAELLERADAALYEAKRAGGDRVHVQGGGSVRAVPAPRSASPARVLVVDDDAGLRMLLRTTFEVAGIEIEEAGDASQASARIAGWLPDVVVLDVGLPGLDGLAYCQALKESPATDGVGVVLLTGDDAASEAAARAAGADALLRKPFSPLELLTVVERLAEGFHAGPFRRAASASTPDRLLPDQLLLYAEDLRRVLDVERAQRRQLQRAYRSTVQALASALESKDLGTRSHSERVQRYGLELALAVEPELAEDPSVEYGFLLHDVGKIGIPDRILLKRGPLSASERRVMKTHTLLGEELLGDVPLLDGEGLRIVRSHHERWDGGGYPDGLAGTQIPLGARILAVADALDAMTSDRPYRAARSWDEAAAEIRRETRQQFDPTVVDAFVAREQALRRTYAALAAA